MGADEWKGIETYAKIMASSFEDMKSVSPQDTAVFLEMLCDVSRALQRLVCKMNEYGARRETNAAIYNVIEAQIEDMEAPRKNNPPRFPSDDGENTDRNGDN